MHGQIRSLLWLPVLCGLAFLALDFLIHGQSWYLHFIQATKILMKSIALLGSLLALFSFGREDRMRLVWLLFSVCMLLNLLFEPINLLLFQQLSEGAVTWIFAGLQFLLDLLLLSTFWVLLSLGRAIDLPLSGPQWLKWVVGVVVMSLSLVVFWPLMVNGFHTVVAGDLSGILLVLAGLFSVVTTVLIVPAIFIARSLRGGLLFWPWAFLLSVMGAWLAFSLLAYLGGVFIDDARMLLTCEILFRCLASMLTFSCGLALRLITRPARERRAQGEKVK